MFLISKLRSFYFYFYCLLKYIDKNKFNLLFSIFNNLLNTIIETITITYLKKIGSFITVII